MTYRKPTTGYRMRPSKMTWNDLESSKVKVANIWAQITKTVRDAMLMLVTNGEAQLTKWRRKLSTALDRSEFDRTYFLLLLLLLSVQCNTCSGQIIRSVFLCLSQSVSESVCLSAKWVYLDGSRNSWGIDMKFGTQVGAPELRRPVVFGKNRKL